jgi:hypothetical protein
MLYKIYAGTIRKKTDGFFGCTSEFISEFFIAFINTSVVMNKTSFRHKYKTSDESETTDLKLS